MIKIFSLLKGAIVVIFVSFGKVQTAIFFDKINFENFLLIKVYIQNIKNWERASDIQELFKIISLRKFRFDPELLLAVGGVMVQT